MARGGCALEAGGLVAQIIRCRQAHLALLGDARQQPPAGQADVIMSETRVGERLERGAGEIGLELGEGTAQPIRKRVQIAFDAIGIALRGHVRPPLVHGRCEPAASPAWSVTGLSPL